MNTSKVGLKINFKKTKILHAGHNSQPSPVTTINGYTLEICNDFLYLGVSTKTPLSVVQEKIGRAWFASANSDLFSFPKPVTTINGYTLEICNDFLYLGVSTKTPLSVVQEKIGRAWFASSNSDLFSFPKSVMLTRCAFLNPRLKQLQHMD